LGSVLSNFSEHLRGLFASGELKQKLAKLGFGALVVILLVLYVVQDPRTFLNVAPEVNVHAHLWGFSLGLFLSLALLSIYSVQKMRKPRSKIENLDDPLYHELDRYGRDEEGQQAGEDDQAGSSHDPLYLRYVSQGYPGDQET